MGPSAPLIFKSFDSIWEEYNVFYHDVCTRDSAGIIYPEEGSEEFTKKRSLDVKGVFLIPMLESLPINA